MDGDHRDLHVLPHSVPTRSSADLPYCPLLAGRAARSTVMKRATRSLTCNVDMPASSCSSNISKTDASILPDTCMSVSASGVFTMSGDRHLRETHMRRRELHLHDVVEGQGRDRKSTRLHSSP